MVAAAFTPAMSDICAAAAELDALSPFELELVARAVQLRQPLMASALSARLASLSAQQQSTQLVSCVFGLADAQVAGRRGRLETTTITYRRERYAMNSVPAVADLPSPCRWPLPWCRRACP